MTTSAAAAAACWPVFGLADLFLGGELAGVAAGAVGGNPGVDELGPQSSICSRAAARASWRPRPWRPGACRWRWPAGRRRRPDDQHPGRADGAGRRGQHGKELGAAGGGDEAALVAGAGRLAGKGVHALGGRCGQEFKGKGGDAPGVGAARRSRSGVGLEQPDQDAPSAGRRFPRGPAG